MESRMLISQRNRFITLAATVVVAACTTGETTLLDPEIPETPTNGSPVLAEANPDQTARVSVAFSYDASRNGAAFTDPDGDEITYTIGISPSDGGLTATEAMISGVPNSAGTFSVTVTATDPSGAAATDDFIISVSDNAAPSLTNANPDVPATTGVAYNYDATAGATAFTDPDGDALTYTVDFTPGANGLTAIDGVISGVPSLPGKVLVTIEASDNLGASATDSFLIVVFATTSTPQLPAAPFAYADADIGLPAHYTNGGVAGTDNTPGGNEITNAGATLGRVLFYDTRLSANDEISCASCHQQEHSFADSAQFSSGFDGGLTGRHSPSLANVRYYERNRMFWDERAETLEEQALMPIADTIEMGLSLDDMELKLALTEYYPDLFEAAFGTPDITRDRVARALAQFVRSMSSFESRFDQAFSNGTPDFASVFTAQELQGEQLFDDRGCDQCHSTNAHVSDDIHNNGLDATTIDPGAGNAEFKSPSLRNIAVSAPYMHDGRFETLEEVIDFYDSGVQDHPQLSNRLSTNGQPDRMNLTDAQKAALVAFLGTLTDEEFLVAPKFGDPFSN